MKTMRSLVFVSVLFASSLGMTQYASGEGPPDETDTDDGPNEATDGEARSLYEAGTAAFSDGRFEDSLARWREAYELSERPELLYNIATALDRLGRPAEAREQYQAYLEAVPDARNTNYVRRRIEVLGNQTQSAEATEPDDVEPEEREAPIVEPEPEPPSRVGPFVLFATAGAALVAGVATALVANNRYDSLDERCPGGECPPDAASDRDDLRRMTRTTDVLFGTAVLSAVAGVVWWVAAGSNESDTQVACGLGHCRVRSRF